MKHAILILAHKDIPHLIHLIEFFERDCDVFVHIDKKCSVSPEEISRLSNMPQVTYISRKYPVRWGGFSILKAQMHLLEQAFKDSKAEYFHVISGQDYPIKPLKEFIDFFKKNSGIQFISFVHLPNKKWQDNTYERFDYYYLYDYINRFDLTDAMRHQRIISYQKRIGIRRRIPRPFDHLYGGSQWFSINRAAMQALMGYHKKNKRFYNRLRLTFAPEETYFMSIICNLIPRPFIINDNHRFIRWRVENGNIPANLGTEHFHLLVESTAFFARKMEKPYCENLIKMLDYYVLNDTPMEKLPNGGWVYRGFTKYNYKPMLTNAIYEYAKQMGFHYGIDAGCGAGNYVAAFRRMGLSFTGFDANPYTPELSALLLNKGDTPCNMADLTDNLQIEDPFDITVCIDVLPFIPSALLYKALDNLVAMTKHSLILGWSKEFRTEYADLTTSIQDYFVTRGFMQNKYASMSLCKKARMPARLIVFEKL